MFVWVPALPLSPPSPFPFPFFSSPHNTVSIGAPTPMHCQIFSILNWSAQLLTLWLASTISNLLVSVHFYPRTHTHRGSVHHDGTTQQFFFLPLSNAKFQENSIGVVFWLNTGSFRSYPHLTVERHHSFHRIWNLQSSDGRQTSLCRTNQSEHGLFFDCRILFCQNFCRLRF